MRSTFRLSLIAASAAFLGSCSCNQQQTYLDVTVEHPAALSSICVKVSATGSAETKESAPIAVSGEKNLKVAIYRDNLPEFVSVKAVGYSDEGCTTPSVPAEESASLRAGFANPPATLTLRMERATGLDVDRDGFSPPEDCDDSDPAIRPGAMEVCNDGLDNDCNGGTDCADTTCDLKTCGSGALCMAMRCAETVCSDRVDGDRDGLTDCADSDCATKSCAVSGTGATCVGTACVEQLCDNGVDDDQDGAPDCRDADCLGASCGTGGMCVEGVDGGAPARCQEPNETLCGDGADNDGDNLIDCADSDCATRACDDSNACSTGETCQGTTCGGGTMTVCDMPPNACFSASGTCNPSNGQCLYGTVAAGTMCSDLDPCTEPDTCDGDGGCSSSPKVCPAAPGACFATGVCQPSLDGGCSYMVMTGSACNDGNNCTVGDQCAPDGGCFSGALTSCTAPECMVFTAGNCDLTGACQYTNANNTTPCDGGTCDGMGACVPADAGFDAGIDAGVDAGVDAGFDAGVDAGFDAGGGGFPYAVDNVVAANFPPQGAFVVNCALTLNSSSGFGAPCPSGSVPTIGVADGGVSGELAVISVSSLVVTDAGSITMSGGRPVVFLVWGDATVNGQLLANSTRASGGRLGPGVGSGSCGGRVGGPGTPSSNNRGGGGGGAGYFTAGAFGGGANNEAASRGDAGILAMGGDAPLFVGCHGGTGSRDTGATEAGEGGGSFQLSVAGTATINAIISTSGQGGKGGTGGSEPGGGGGGSGGALLIQANQLVATANAKFTSNGGAGGGGAQGLTAGDGADGATDTATPATGGTLSGGGGAGGAGGAGATNPVNGQTVSRGGGGGGGAAGRIFFKHYDSGTACSISGSAVISPAAARTNCP